MKKILILPFLQIPSGHQQASDALISYFENHDSTIQCQKIDLFSYSYGKLENLVSHLYLKWIHYFPKSYNKLYFNMVLQNLEKSKEKYIYENFFKSQIKKLIEEYQPDCIISTHSLPSRLLSKLKRDAAIRVPVFNVYTDFFIHKGWGVEHIDGHFISTPKMQNYLLSKSVKKDQIHFTGIPVHPIFKRRPILAEHPKSKASILISGGSMGAGGILQLINKLKKNTHLHYFVLCGKNRSLYHTLNKKQYSHITPIPFIHSRKMMELIYNHTDLIITKPGGVTVSECIHKRIPIMIYDKLPGQEEINFNELKGLQLVLDGCQKQSSKNYTDTILNFLYSPKHLSEYFYQLHQYEKNKLNSHAANIIYEHIS